MTCHPSARLNRTWRCTSCATEEKKTSDRVRTSMLNVQCHAFQDDGDYGVRQGGEMMVAVTFAVGKDPGGHNLIDGAEETMRRNGYGDVRPEHAGFLALPQNTFDEIKILHQKVV